MSVTTNSKLPDASVVRIFNASGVIVGTGFLVAERSVITCAHVINAALMRDEDSEIFPVEEIQLDFLGDDSSMRLLGVVECWNSPKELHGQAGVDVALLKILCDAPAKAKVAPLSIVSSLWKRSFRTVGFPEGYDDGRWVSGTVDGILKGGRIQIQGAAAGPIISPGFSGSFVWDESLNAVLGMVVQSDTDPTTRTASMIPVAIIREVCPIVDQGTLKVTPNSNVSTSIGLNNPLPAPNSSFANFGGGDNASRSSFLNPDFNSIGSHIVKSATESRKYFEEVSIEEIASYAGHIDLDDIVRKYTLAIELSTELESDKKIALSLFDEVQGVFEMVGPPFTKWLPSIDLFRGTALIFSDNPQYDQARPLLLKSIRALRRDAIPKDELVNALTMLAHTYVIPDRKHWAKAEKVQVEILSLMTDSKDAIRIADERCVLSSCLHMKSKPDWGGAVREVNEALNTFRAYNEPNKTAAALKQKAWILLAMPSPSPEEAVKCYEEAIGLLSSPKQREDKADFLSRLADCLINHSEPPDWERGEGYAEEAVELLFEINSSDALDGASDLFDLYLQKPVPDFRKAGELCEKTLKLKSTRTPQAKSVIYFNWAKCLEKQELPDWEKAIQVSSEAVKNARKIDSPQLLSDALHQLGFFYLEAESPDVNKAAAVYRELISLLDEHGDVVLRVSARHNLAFCLFHQPQPAYKEALTVCESALRIAQDGHFIAREAFFAKTYLLAAEISENSPSPLVDIAVKYYGEALKYLRSPKDALSRALALNHLSFAHYAYEPKDWDAALKASSEAVRSLAKVKESSLDLPGKAHWRETFADTLGQLASIYQQKPSPDHRKSIQLYERSLGYLDAPEMLEKKANTLHLLALVYWFKPRPSYEKANENLRNAISASRQCGSIDNLRIMVPEMGLLLSLEEKPIWEDVIDVCKESETLVRDTKSETEVFNLVLLSSAYHQQKSPDWSAAKDSLEKAIEIMESNKARFAEDLVGAYRTLDYIKDHIL